MYVSCRESVPLPSLHHLLRALTGIQDMLSLLPGSSLHTSPDMLSWPLSSRSSGPLSITGHVVPVMLYAVSGPFPTAFRIWNEGLQLWCEASPTPDPQSAWALIKPLQNCSCGLQASTSAHWLKAWWGGNHRSCGSFQNSTDGKGPSVISAQPDRANSLRDWGQGVGVPGFWRLPGVTKQRGSTVASSGNFQRIQVPARTFLFYKQTVFYFLEYNYKHTCSNCGIFP